MPRHEHWRFFKTIQWRPTLQVAAIRIGIASVVWSLFFFILGNDEIVELRRRLVAIEPENIKFKDYLAGSLFVKGKLLWDDGNNSAAFESYIEGLHHFLDTGQVMSKAAPLTARIAFRACKMFSKQALERDSNADLGVRFFDWCERAGIDANEDIDISDARTK